MAPAVAMDQKSSRISIVKPLICGLMMDDRSCSVLVQQGDRDHLTKRVLHISPNGSAVETESGKQRLSGGGASLCKMCQSNSHIGVDRGGHSLFCSRVCMGQRDCADPCIVIQPYSISQALSNQPFVDILCTTSCIASVSVNTLQRWFRASNCSSFSSSVRFSTVLNWSLAEDYSQLNIDTLSSYC